MKRRLERARDCALAFAGVFACGYVGCEPHPWLIGFGVMLAIALPVGAFAGFFYPEGDADA